MAADWPAEKFEKAVGTIDGKVRSVGRSSSTWQTHMIALDKLLMPRGAEPMDVQQTTGGSGSVRFACLRPETGG